MVPHCAKLQPHYSCITAHYNREIVDAKARYHQNYANGRSVIGGYTYVLLCNLRCNYCAYYSYFAYYIQAA